MQTREYHNTATSYHSVLIDPFSAEKDRFQMRFEVIKRWEFRGNEIPAIAWRAAEIRVCDIYLAPDQVAPYIAALELAAKEAARLDAEYPPGENALTEGGEQ